MEIKDLQRFQRLELRTARRQLRDAGYDLAYGSTYTVQDIRKAIQDKQPALIQLKGRTYLAVGENPESLILLRNGKLKEYADKLVLKTFKGDAVIVQKGPVRRSGNELVIFTPEADTWPAQWLPEKQHTIAYIGTIQQGAPWLPDHPVIATFKRPTAAQDRNDVKASTEGVEVSLYDPIDPVTDFLTELGHIYYDNRLNGEEKQAVLNHYKSLKNGTVAALYTDKAMYKNERCLFAALYMFYVKAQTMNPGYARLLDIYEQPGRDLLEGIFSRIEAEQEAEQRWEAHAPKIAKALDGQVRKKFIVKDPTGTRVVYARHPFGPLPDDIVFPRRSVTHRVIYQADNGREWIRITGGQLEGRELALQDGVLDLKLTRDAVRGPAPVKSQGSLFDRVRGLFR